MHLKDKKLEVERFNFERVNALRHANCESKHPISWIFFTRVSYTQFKLSYVSNRQNVANWNFRQFLAEVCKSIRSQNISLRTQFPN